MKKYYKLSRLKFTALALLLGAGLHATAQTTYIVDFETANTSPSDKSYAATTTITTTNPGDPSITMDWTMEGVYLGNMSTDDWYDGDRSARMRLTNNSTGNQGYIASNDFFPDGVGTVTFTSRMYGVDSFGHLSVEYRGQSDTVWTQVDSEINVPLSGQGEQTFTVGVYQQDPVRIRIIRSDASLNAMRIDIDNIEITDYVAPPFEITNWFPTGSGIDVNHDHLMVIFSDDAEANTGNIELYEEGNSTPIFTADATDPNVVINNNEVTINGITLTNNTSYYVLMDAGAFKRDTDESEVIDNPNYWTFSTINDSLIFLNDFIETFDDCDNNGSNFGVFTAYSVLGDAGWKCGSFGHDDDHAVYINGGSEPNESEANEDWLITKSAIDLTAAEEATLSFAYQTRFDGFLEKTVQISADYDGEGDPYDFTWTTLDIEGFDVDHGHGNWSTYEYDLSTLIDQPFYLAFTYESDENGAKEYSLDDIQIESSVSIIDLTNNVKAFVLGTATRNAINLNIESPTAQYSKVNIFDMQGRLVHEANVTLSQTAQTITLQPNLSATGLYIIQIEVNGKTYALKAMVQ